MGGGGAQEGGLEAKGYEALIRAHARTPGEGQLGVQLLDEMQTKGLQPSDGCLMTTVVGCVDSKNIELAERAVEVYRTGNEGWASLKIYSALMKVYASSRLWTRTCDLYPRMLK